MQGVLKFISTIALLSVFIVSANVAAQDAIFHSVLGLLNVIDGPYDPQRDIFQVR